MVIDLTSLRAQLQKEKKPFVFSLYDKNEGIPAQSLLVHEELLYSFSSDTVDAEQFVQIAISLHQHSVSPQFTFTALNSINSLYYSSCDEAFHHTSDLATLYVKNRMVQYAILNQILSYIPKKDIQIKEICAGSVYSRWQHFAKYMPQDVKMHVTLADFSHSIIPIDEIRSRHIRRMTFDNETYDLRKLFPLRDQAQKLDVMLSTYGFDSVWDEQDAMYVLGKNKRWYMVLYRVSVSPTSKHHDFLLECLRKGSSATSVPLHFFKDVFVETIIKEIDIDRVQYGSFIKKAYGNYSAARVVVPGLMVERIKEAFASQLHHNGIFVIGEVGLYPLKQDEEMDMTISDYNTTGKVGKYKVEDTYLAQMILESDGFKVEVSAIDAVAKKFGKKISDDTEDTWLMVVRHNKV